MASFQIFQDPDNVPGKKQASGKNGDCKENSISNSSITVTSISNTNTNSSTITNNCIYKLKDKEVMWPNRERAVLSTLSNNNSLRVQPTRAAKQKQPETSNSKWLQDENSVTYQKAVAVKPFTILEERPSIHPVEAKATYWNLGTCTVEDAELLELSSTVTMLQRSDDSDISVELEINDSVVEESPMVLDGSLEDRQTRQRRRTASEALYVPEYADDIYSYLRDVEVRHQPKSMYMKKQPDITHAMRSVLVDWLVEVGEEYKLQAETLYLAVSYIDRFLSCMSVLRGKLQLVGTAAMFIASKYEEIYPPDVGEFVYITDDTYTKKQVLRMEHLVLKVLSFDLAVPTSNWFIDRYCDLCSAKEITKYLAKYLSELTLLDGETFMKYHPSMIAASSVAVANHCVGADAWGEGLEESSGYCLADLKDCFQKIQHVYLTASSHPQKAIRDKYKSSKYCGVSTLTQVHSVPW